KSHLETQTVRIPCVVSFFKAADRGYLGHRFSLQTRPTVFGVGQTKEEVVGLELTQNCRYYTGWRELKSIKRSTDP
ncbi:hypothetical protein Trydic_g5876, partial [Trypoxylus dichotomus]